MSGAVGLRGTCRRPLAGSRFRLRAVLVLASALTAPLSATPASAQTAVDGGAFSAQAAAGWTNATEPGQRVQGVDIRLLLTGPSRSAFTSNVVVTSEPRPRGLRLRTLVKRSRRQVARALRARVERTTRRLRLAGEPAYAYRYSFRARGRPARGEQLLAYRDDTLHVVTLTTHRTRFARDRRAAMALLLRTWAWK